MFEGISTRLLAVLLLLVAAPLQAADLLVACASNFSGAMSVLVAEFERTHGHKVAVAYGSSGKFYAQIRMGAPFDLFMSADAAKPVALETEGYTVPGSRFTYALGTLALWSPDEDTVVDSATLAGNAFTHLALANPQLAPYGRAAVQTLTSLNLAASTRGRWVQGENIAQAFQFVDSANAELGFVALSQVIDPRNGSVSSGSAWIVPSTLHEPIRQQAVVLRRATSRKIATSFAAFLGSLDRLATGWKAIQPSDIQ